MSDRSSAATKQFTSTVRKNWIMMMTRVRVDHIAKACIDMHQCTRYGVIPSGLYSLSTPANELYSRPLST